MRVQADLARTSSYVDQATGCHPIIWRTFKFTPLPVFARHMSEVPINVNIEYRDLKP
jgi:hypothetical protein